MKNNGGVQKSARRRLVLEMLQKQLKEGTKTKKGTRDVKIPLEERDVKRINNEIQILKKKI